MLPSTSELISQFKTVPVAICSPSLVCLSITISAPVVVSEETGTVSIAESGELSRGYDKSKLEAFLRSRLIPEKASEDKLDKAKKGLRRWIK